MSREISSHPPPFLRLAVRTVIMMSFILRLCLCWSWFELRSFDYLVVLCYAPRSDDYVDRICTIVASLSSVWAARAMDRSSPCFDLAGLSLELVVDSRAFALIMYPMIGIFLNISSCKLCPLRALGLSLIHI